MSNDKIDPKIPAALQDIITGALFDLMGMLTSNEAAVTFSSRHDASPAVDAIKVFCAKRGLIMDEAAVGDWQEKAAAYAMPPLFRVHLDKPTELVTGGMEFKFSRVDDPNSFEPSGGSMKDEFNGSDEKLLNCISALIDLDSKGALVPHGIGGHASKLLQAAACRIAARPAGYHDAYRGARDEMLMWKHRAESAELELSIARKIVVVPAEKPAPEVKYSTGHCKDKALPGGCPHHNVHCGYPTCDRREVNHE